MAWDTWGLFPLSVTDALGNEVVVVMDEVALQPSSARDPNENYTLARYDALGRLVAVAVQGKSGEGLGDTLADPTLAHGYELHRWKDSGLPARASTTIRASHAARDFLYRHAYSDGAGNLVQEKVSAEPGDVGGVATDPRWVGTGRVILNNKGLPCRQYEPFFSATAECEFDVEASAAGVSSTVYYDPVGRARKVALPSGCLRKVTFTAREQAFHDENDTSAGSDCTADAALVARAAAHAGTPTTVYLDHLGRPVATDELPDDTGTTYTTAVTLDDSGNPVAITDARDIVTQSQVFDLLGRPLQEVSPDAGTTTTFMEVAGNPVRTWRSGDLLVEAGYDALRRRTTLLVTEGTATPRLVEVNEYGEGQGTASNHQGRLWRQWDTAGRVVHDSYDFEGNLALSTRRFWDWRASGEQVTWGDDAADTPSATLLETEEFPTTREYDALGRVVTRETPDGSVTTFTYNEASLLESVAVLLPGATTATTFVSGVEYNARGQRSSITYGNGVSTAHTYDPDTFRLARLVTTRASDSAVLQDLVYEHDPAGNITAIANDADDTQYFNATAVSPDQSFTYDATYRLIEATGRERASLGYLQPGDEPAYGNRPDVATAVQSYTQSYTYDEAGNITEMDHLVGSGSAYNWTRAYAYASTSNRLSSTTVGTTTESFSHDARGSIVYLPSLRFSSSLSANIETDFRDQARKVHLATSGHYALYFYDAAGQRARKVVVTDKTTERIYIGGAWEVYRDHGTGTTVQEERETLHVMDGEQRVAMVETLTISSGTPVSPPAPVQRYQLGNHLGSVALELDSAGSIISYEEYHPHGTTAWRAPELATVSLKRYRYTGMERDPESGLQCHGRRYYVPWLGRWLSADPLGVAGGVNRYAYAAGAPSQLVDGSGLFPTPGLQLACESDVASPADPPSDPTFSLGSPPEQPGLVAVVGAGGVVEYLRQDELDARASAVMDRVAAGDGSLLIANRSIDSVDGVTRATELTQLAAEDFAVATLVALDQIAHTGVGLSVLESLVASGRPTVIARTSGVPSALSISSGVIGHEPNVVLFNPDLGPEDLAGPDGESESWWQGGNVPVVALGHELMHAFRRNLGARPGGLARREVTDFGPQGVSLTAEAASPEEFQVTGLYEFSGGYFTENRLRAELGAERRERYNR